MLAGSPVAGMLGLGTGAGFVSESTVKFHVHNLLGKTGCSRRVELLAAFGAFGA